MSKREEELQSENDTLRNVLAQLQERNEDLEIQFGIMRDRYITEVNLGNDLKAQLIRTNRKLEGIENAGE